jgi:hypothetical protein
VLNPVQLSALIRAATSGSPLVPVTDPDYLQLVSVEDPLEVTIVPQQTSGTCTQVTAAAYDNMNVARWA